VGLKFDCIGTGFGHGIYKGVRHSQTAVVCLGNLCHNEARFFMTNRLIADVKMLQHYQFSSLLSWLRYALMRKM
jgi:hypothetical protein